MDGGVSELEFASLRSISGASSPAVVVLGDDDEPGGHTKIVSRPASRQAFQLADEAVADKSLSHSEIGITKEVVAVPVVAPSDLDLDYACQNHIQGLIKQNVENVGLQDRDWEELLRPLPLEIGQLVTHDVLEKIACTRGALAKAAVQLQGLQNDHKSKDAKSAKSSKPKDTPQDKETDKAKAAVERRRQESDSGTTVEKGKGCIASPSDFDLYETARHILLEDLNNKRSIDISPEPSTSKGPTLPKLTRFLICVSEDVGNSRKTTFEAGVFNGAPLFQQDDEEADSSEKSTILHEDAFDYVGGTIHLKAPEREWNRIEKILALIVYAACHLKLEMHVLRDSGCPRPPPLPEKDPPRPSKLREPSEVTIRAEQKPLEIDSATSEGDIGAAQVAFADDPISPVTNSSDDDNKPMSKGHGKKWSRANLVGLIFGTSQPPEQPSKLKKRFGGKLKMHRTRSLKRFTGKGKEQPEPLSPNDLPLRMPGALAMEDWELVAPEKKVVVEMARSEEEEAGEALTAPGSPVDSKEERDTAPSLPLVIPAESKPVVEATGGDRFEHVIERMQRALLSISSDVHFDPPTLLVQLRDQETLRKAANREITKGLGLSKKQSQSEEILDSYQEPSADGLPASSSSPVLSSTLDTPVATPLPDKFRISMDNRAGLASLMTGNNSLDGTLRHQSLPCLFEKVLLGSQPSIPMCQPPVWRKILYYDLRVSSNFWETATDLESASVSDLTLGDLVWQLLMQTQSECSAHCGKTGQEHNYSIIHAASKINFTIKESLIDIRNPETLCHFITCSVCGKRSDITAVSGATQAISSGKYLELLLYDRDSHPTDDELCRHVKDPASLVRIFWLQGRELHIKLDSLSLYQLRLPTSVDPDKKVSTSDRTAEEATMLESVKTSLKNEVHDLFASIRTQFANRSQADDSSDAPDRGPPLMRPTSDIDDLDSGEELLLKSIGQASPRDVNDIRWRILQYCERYHNADQLGPINQTDAKIPPARSMPAELVAPEYARYDDLHVLPADNHVIIREKEMSSFLAYTLSSSHYLDIVQTKPEFAASHRQASPNKAPHLLSPAVSIDHLSLEEPRHVATPSSTSSISSSSLSSASSSIRGSARLSGDYELSAKTKRTVKPTGSILSLKATTPRARLQDIFSITEGHTPLKGSSPRLDATGFNFSNDDDDKVLEGLLSSTKVTSSKTAGLPGTKGPALPSLISSLTSRRQVSGATASSALSQATGTPAMPSLDNLDISIQHGRAQSIRSVSTVDSEISAVTEDTRSSHETIRIKETEQEALPPLSTRAGLAKGSAFSTLSGFLNRGLRLKNVETPDLSKTATGSGPHVKLTFRHENKKMSCIVYYAEGFAALRKACGLSELSYINSLERSDALQFSGGKTSAGFWLTQDGRFVLKQMRTSWNVSEVDAMLTFAPNYLEYLTNAKRPSLLTKIFGMYTCKVKDLKTGEKRKMDLVVMEHLFHGTNVTRKFDLKGISSRVARTKGEGETLWDADWVASVQTRLLIHAHHKAVLTEAIAADTEFLENNNVMDYSCLVGVDDQNKTITLGLIDILGIFNLAKAIESNSKRVLQAERTIVPPDEYAARFRKAMHQYIIASPEKFSKSPGDNGVPALNCPL